MTEFIQYEGEDWQATRDKIRNELRQKTYSKITNNSSDKLAFNLMWLKLFPHSRERVRTQLVDLLIPSFYIS